MSTTEGRKYYHFFKHMLLGSEEHYYITMLYNWERTRSFVGSLAAQTVWNTWKFGVWVSGWRSKRITLLDILFRPGGGYVQPSNESCVFF